MKNQTLNNLYTQKIIDKIDQGILIVDSKGTIKLCNTKLLNIFGLNNNYKINHKNGIIKKGDIVCYASNSTGTDDGNINKEALNKLGFKGNVPYNEPFIIIGKYMTNEKPIIKFVTSNENIFSLNKNIYDIDFNIEVNLLKKSINIAANSNNYKFNYIFAVGHIVVIDSINKNVKFYQSRGFTARKESAREILMAMSFQNKSNLNKPTNLIGKNIATVFKHNSIISDIIKCALGDNIEYTNQFKQINGIPTLFSLTQISDEQGNSETLLKIDDVSEIHNITNSYNTSIRKLKELENKIIENSIVNNTFKDFIGESTTTKNLKKQIYKASLSNSNILILGETGTGKTHLAKSIHNESSRRNFPFVHVNCATIPNELIESILFGYEEGAFTGAKKKGNIGLFESANNGTIFLDEISELDFKLQAKLLKVLQDKTFYKVGSTREIKVDVRLISATNKNLVKYIELGKFRNDLYYRINVFSIYIEPLRNRKDDIIDLSQNIIKNICKKYDTPNKNITHEAQIKLNRYLYPGNVRELENILERAVNTSSENIILSEDIVFDTHVLNEDKKSFKSLKEYVNNAEENIIKEALNYYNNDKLKVMEVLKIKRTTFYDKLKKYKL
ncbi:sigma-54 interaction domain-containing protein [Helicovermis profundi]|uniref:Sigma 54-interacting transcriptional regulator n=1 Tax=Helicovermis profundi TaxID=3065157 RepID=A0AAU9EDD7_9FIRM|nr:sigma 54-interacting transcriptional regulator [Clostridia bacterium S502]